MKRILTLFLLITSVTTYAQKNKLQLNLQLDSIYYLTHNMSMTITENIQGQTLVFTNTVGCKISHKVTGIKDTTYELAVAYESLAMHMDIGGKTIDINSEMGGHDVISKLLMQMLHRPITVIISKTGHVLDVKNNDNLYAHMFDSIPNISAEKKAQFKLQMEQSFGEKALKTNFQDAFAVFPNNPVSINDKWIVNTQLDKVIFANIKTTYTLKGINDNSYNVQGQAEVTPIENAEYSPINGMPVNCTQVNGTVTADYHIDKKSGWITYAKISKIIKAQMNIKDNPKLPGGVSFPLLADIDFTTTNK